MYSVMSLAEALKENLTVELLNLDTFKIQLLKIWEEIRENGKRFEFYWTISKYQIKIKKKTFVSVLFIRIKKGHLFRVTLYILSVRMCINFPKTKWILTGYILWENDTPLMYIIYLSIMHKTKKKGISSDLYVK